MKLTVDEVVRGFGFDGRTRTKGCGAKGCGVCLSLSRTYSSLLHLVCSASNLLY